jgi:exo-beta-1,3-glucanase (GH17 family)
VRAICYHDPVWRSTPATDPHGAPDHNRQALRRIEPISARAPLALLLVSLTIIVAVWSWLAKPVMLARAPIDSSAKLECVSYAPFRGDQSPRDPTLEVSAEQIREDLVNLAAITRCVRTYSVDNGLDKVPELATQVGLKVFLGIWIGNNQYKNAQLIDTAIALSLKYPQTVAAIIVGNEVLLHGDMTPSDLRELLLSVKKRVKVPVTYADTWDYWLRYREIQDAVDFVTIHVLPYWDDIPTRAENAAARVAAVHEQLSSAFPGKEVVIGETGWPSMGRMREGALPSRINQARVISEILEVAKRDNFRVNLIEAFDASWKRYWEGTVGGYWGLFLADHATLKYPPGVPISNYPRWRLLMGSGLILAIAVFVVAWFSLRRRPWKPRLSSWIAVGISATVAGILFGISIDKMFYESFGWGGWLRWGSLLVASAAMPLLCAYAVMSGRALPSFLALMGPRDDRAQSISTLILGLNVLVVIVVATGAALGSVFDPRWQDLPFASLTMAAVPMIALSWLNRPGPGARPIAETVFAGVFFFSAAYIVFIEGTENWQALWTSGAYILLGLSMVGVRSKDALARGEPTISWAVRGGIRDAGSTPNSRAAFAEDIAPSSSATW